MPGRAAGRSPCAGKQKKTDDAERSAAHAKNFRSVEDTEPTDPRLPVSYEAGAQPLERTVKAGRALGELTAWILIR